MSWNNIAKPVTDSFSKLVKPTDVTTTIPHAKGKFMGILGLTYAGTSVTDGTKWVDFVKPTTDSFNKLVKPI